MSNRKALLVGINYPDSHMELRGCVNDVNTMHDILKTYYGFRDIVMLTDNRATTNNMLNAMEELVADAQPGDVLYFHYSGHGSQIKDNFDDDYEPDGLDEIICPVDLNWRDKIIRDDDIKRIFGKTVPGVNLTVVLDCCHSGGGMDHIESYQPLGVAGEKTVNPGRYLPPPPEFQETGEIKFKRRALSRNINSTSLLISGCQSHQTSADALFGTTWMGACTYAIADQLRENPEIDYNTLVVNINKNLRNWRYTQRPELNGPAALHDKQFLASFADATDVVSDTEQVQETYVPPKQEKKKKSDIHWYALGGAALAVVCYFLFT